MKAAAENVFLTIFYYFPVGVAEPSVLRGALCGHTDSVWGLVYSSAHHRLLSCSADGTVRLWNAADTSPSLAVFNERGGEWHISLPLLLTMKYSDTFLEYKY